MILGADTPHVAVSRWGERGRVTLRGVADPMIVACHD